MWVSILARSKVKRIRPKHGRNEEKTMLFSPTPNTIEAKRNKFVQNFAISGLLEICSNRLCPSMAPYGMEGAWLWTPKSQTYTVGGFNVSNLMGIKRRMIDIGKKLLFTFCKMFESVQFFRICSYSMQKVLLWPQKFFSWKISIWMLLTFIFWKPASTNLKSA